MKDTITDKDIIVAEVRKARDDHARQFGYDPEAIVADIQKQQKVKWTVNLFLCLLNVLNL